MKLSPLRLYALIAAAVCAAPVLESKAALLVYEPFDYTATPGLDQNGDGKKDLMGLGGGLGWANAWTETTGTATVLTDYPLDFIKSSPLDHPSGDLRFGSGGSLELFGFTATGKPTQISSTLSRGFEDPISLDAGSEVWFSVLLRKDAENPAPGGGTRPTDQFSLQLIDSAGLTMVSLFDSGDDAFYSLQSDRISSPLATLQGRGPALGRTDFLVAKLSLEVGKSRLEFFLNPSLELVFPTVPDLTISINDAAMLQDLVGMDIRTDGSSRMVWTLDEIRVGESYADVVPEPSSLLLTGLGMAMFGGARLRRSRASQN
jgi:hypothetical protein